MHQEVLVVRKMLGVLIDSRKEVSNNPQGVPNVSEMTKYIQNQIPAPIKMVKFRINRDKT